MYLVLFLLIQLDALCPQNIFCILAHAIQSFLTTITTNKETTQKMWQFDIVIKRDFHSLFCFSIFIIARAV